MAPTPSGRSLAPRVAAAGLFLSLLHFLSFSTEKKKESGNPKGDERKSDLKKEKNSTYVPAKRFQKNRISNHF